MGCHASRLEEARGVALFRRVEAIKGRRHPSTLSKKQLLSLRDDMKISVSSRPSDGAAVSLEDIITNTPKGARDSSQEIKIETKGNVGIAIIIVSDDNKPVVINDAKKEGPKKGVTFSNIDGEKEEDEDEDQDDEERRIGYDQNDGEAFPGSPSFRVYFDENREHSHNETVKYGDAFSRAISTDDNVAPKVVSSHVEKKVKIERRKRCLIRKVLPKRGSQADVKRILNMKSCYS